MMYKYMIPKIWGPSMWMTMHTISFAYPIEPTDDDKHKYKQFYISIGDVLPCAHCKTSYKELIGHGVTLLDDDVMDSRESLSKWVYYVHNAVNDKLGVNYGVTYDDVVKKYAAFSVDCSGKENCDELGRNVSFKIANEKDYPIIPHKIAKHYVNYAKERHAGGLYKDEWDERNRKCKQIVDHMRENNVMSLESDGKWKGLPTVEETQLIMMFMSNLSKEKLVELIAKLPQCVCEYKKIYKLVQ